MTVAVGNVVVPAAIFPYASAGTAAENLANGIVVDNGLVMGTVSVITGAPNMVVTWNNGTPTDTTVHNDTLRFVDAAADATVQAFRGKVVRLNAASHEFTGPVVSIFALEAATVGKAGDGAVVTVEVVLFRLRSGQYVLALASNVTVVAGQ